MKWTLLKCWLKWQIGKTRQMDAELDKLYQHEKRINADAIRQLSARLENLEIERRAAAIGALPL